MFRKKITMLAVGVAAVAALMGPATASAQWTHNHATLGANAAIQLTGQWKFQGEVGNIECQVNAVGQLTAGTTTGHISEFGVDVTGAETVTDNCQVGGGLATLGCTDVSSVTSAGFPWGIHLQSTQTIDITTGTIQTHLHGGFFCPKTDQITPGTLVLHMEQQDTWTQGQITGELQVDPSIGSPQNVTYGGLVSITPGGTYGGHA
jgi:hypothetical protein